MNFVSNIIKSHLFAAIICKGGGAVLTFLFTWLIARVLTTSDAGVFLYTYTVMMVLVQLSRAGTEYSMISWLSGDVDSRICLDSVIKICVYVTGMAVLFSSIFLLLTQFGLFEVYKKQEAIDSLLCFLGVGICFTLCQVLGTYFQTKAQIYRQYWSMAIGVSFIGCTVSISAYYLDSHIDVLQLSRYFLAGNVVCLLSCVYLFLKSIAKIKITDSNVSAAVYDESFVSVIKHTLPYSQLAFIMITVQWGAILLAGIWLNEADLAILTVVMRLGVLVSFLFLAFNAILAPKFSKIFKDGELGKLEDEPNMFMFISSLFGSLLFMVFIFFGEKILFLFGAEYVNGYKAMLVISFFTLLNVLMGPCQIILLMTNNASIAKRNLLIASGVAIILSLVLIPNYGVLGSVFATSIAGFTLNTLSYLSVKSIFSINYFTFQSIQRQFKATKHKFITLLKVKSRSD
jgi:O-antigen/teichoic acid export membrane protein